MDVVSGALDVVECPNCGEASEARFRLCGFCGHVLAADRPLDEVSRYVTIVTSDLKGSTALGERLDPESLREVLTRYFDEMRAVLESHGGTIEKIIGDAIVAVFGMPVRRDDDAVRAVRAAAETMQVLARLNDQLEAIWGVRLVTRTGVSTGEVAFGNVSARQHVLTGETMKVSSAMEQNAPPLEVLISGSTYDLVRDLVEVEPVGLITPKGEERGIPAYRLIAVRSPADGVDAAQGPATAEAGNARHCPNCGEENPARHRLCGTCGASLAAVSTAQESRKTVTLVFADPKPRTESGEAPSPAALRAVMSRYFDEMTRALERHGGTVEKFIGDAVMAVYGLPVRHEDDALRALRAALDMQAALPALNEEFAATWGVRLLNAIGVNTGEVITGDATLGQRLVTGDAVNVAARLEQAAGPAEIIIGELTYRLARGFVEVEPMAPLALKGKAEPVPAYRLVAISRDAADSVASVTPFVGREEEMLRLERALARSSTERVTRMLTVVGDAGVGKSRLIKEFAARAGEVARVIRGRCLPYGDGITFWPLAEVVREAASIAGDDTREVAIGKLDALLEREGSDPSERQAVLERVAAVIGLSAAQFPVGELFWGSRKLLEAMGDRKPLVVIVDDIHSAEQTFLELLDHLVEAGHDSSVLLLCSARHELLEVHAEWSDSHAEEFIILRPLSDEDSGRIVEELLGQAGLDASVIARITTAAEGNPLFVEQMVSMLVDTGMLHQEDGRWLAAPAHQIAVPPTIHALLAARFDSLAAEEKGVLEPASVIGLLFPVPAVAELVDQAARESLAANLASLDQKQLVKPTEVDEDEGFRFAHLLVRDTVYGSLLKRARALYHERFVDWAERVNAERERGQEFEEIHGYHLEQAYRYRTELGVVDDAARHVGRRASMKLASAGRRALGRGDIPAAANLLRRATETREPGDPERLALIPDLGVALMELGEFADALARLEEARRLASEAADEVLAARAGLVARDVQKYAGGTADWTVSTSHEVDRVLPLFEAAGDEAGQTLAWRLRTGIYGNAGRFSDFAMAAERVIEHARRIGDVRAEKRAAITYATAAVYGPTPVLEAIARCEGLVESSGTDRIALVTIQLQLAQLYAMRGDFARARDLYRGARERLEDLHAGIAGAKTSIDASRVEMLAGDWAAAERELRLDQQALTALGENYFRYTVEGLLARAVLAQGRVEEAGEIIAAVRHGAAADDSDAQALWRSVMARALAAGGDAPAGVDLAIEAVALRRETDSPVDLADALEDLALVLRAAGRSGEADDAFSEAVALARAKGDVVSEARFLGLARVPSA